jgi:hypothetical protein
VAEQQYVGIDLHRRRSVIVRRDAARETLDTVCIDNERGSRGPVRGVRAVTILQSPPSAALLRIRAPLGDLSSLRRVTPVQARVNICLPPELGQRLARARQREIDVNVNMVCQDAVEDLLDRIDGGEDS